MKKTITILAIACTPGLFMNSYAQEQAAGQPRDLQYIMEIAGNWEGPATMKTDGKELHFTYHADFKKIAAGNGLDMHEWCDIPGMGKMDGGNLIGFDPNDGKIHWYSVDNMGTTHEHVGSFSDHDHFSMVHKSMHEGKEYLETLEMVRKGKDKLYIKLVGMTNGKEDEVITADFQRKGGKPIAAK
jgi:hypothetical protein